MLDNGAFDEDAHLERFRDFGMEVSGFSDLAGLLLFHLSSLGAPVGPVERRGLLGRRVRKRGHC